MVTGAGGFIGRYVVSDLLRKHQEVFAAVHSENGIYHYTELGIPCGKIELGNKNTIFGLSIPSPIEAIIHCAGLLSIDASDHSPGYYFTINTMGTYYMLEYARAHNVKKFIFPMTHSDLGLAKGPVVTEDTPLQFGGPIGEGSPLPYIISKIAAFNFIQVYAKETEISPYILRLPGVRGFGSRDTLYNSVFHQFIQKAIKGEPIEIWGEHKTVRDLVYVKDVAYAFRLCLHEDAIPGVYNIGTGRGMTIEDEARAIIRVFSNIGNPSKLVYRPDIEEVRKYSQVFGPAKSLIGLGYSPRFSYEEGLRDMKREMELDRFKELE